MTKKSRIRRMIISIGIITLVTLGFSAYFLFEIAGTNSNSFTLEWNIIRMGFLFTLMFIALSIRYVIMDNSIIVNSNN